MSPLIELTLSNHNEEGYLVYGFNVKFSYPTKLIKLKNQIKNMTQLLSD